MLSKKKWLSAQKSGAEGIFYEKAVAIIYTERGSTFQDLLKRTERDIHSAAGSGDCWLLVDMYRDYRKERIFL